MTKISSPSFLYGIHAVSEFLQQYPEQIELIYLLPSGESKENNLTLLGKQAAAHKVKVRFHSRFELDRIAQNNNHQGVIAVCKEYQYQDIDQMIKHSKQHKTPPLLFLLDSVTDPQNLGNLIRSTYVLGGNGVILPKDRSASVTASVIKASTGATSWLSIAQVPNLVRAMQTLKEEGFWIFGTVVEGPKTQVPWQVDFSVPTAFVLGSEGEGLRPLVQKNCDVLLSIPMQGKLKGGSLNVATCGAILLYEAMKQRLAK